MFYSILLGTFSSDGQQLDSFRDNLIKDYGLFQEHLNIDSSIIRMTISAYNIQEGVNMQVSGHYATNYSSNALQCEKITSLDNLHYRETK